MAASILTGVSRRKLIVLFFVHPFIDAPPSHIRGLIHNPIAGQRCQEAKNLNHDNILPVHNSSRMHLDPEMAKIFVEVREDFREIRDGMKD